MTCSRMPLQTDKAYYILSSSIREQLHSIKSLVMYEETICRYPSIRFSFVLCRQGSSLLWTPALWPSESVQYASPWRGGELIDVCGVRPMWGEGGKVGLSSLSRISKRAPSRRGLLYSYCLTKPLFSASPTGLPISARPPDWHYCSISQET